MLCYTTVPSTLRWSLGFLALVAAASGLSAHYVNARPDAHAPIGVMGDHTHEAGEFMFSYRYMRMNMDGMRFGEESISADDVWSCGTYVITPVSMTMDMHMGGVMYAPTDWVTLMGMAMYRESEMDHRIDPAAAMLVMLNGGSDTFTTSSSGIGDTVLSALVRFYSGERYRAHAGFGISLPTGSIGEQDIVPGPGGRIQRQLPAPMQLGSGTFDFIPAITVLGQPSDALSWGVQARAVLRLNENWHDYALGNQFEWNTWGGWAFSDWLSLEVRLRYLWEDEMEGQQSSLLLNPPFAPSRRTVPTAFSENYGGTTVEAGIGLNFYLPRGSLRGHRLAVEMLFPLYRDLNGYRLETDWTVIVGWQKAFH